MAQNQIITNDNIRQKIQDAIASWSTSDEKPPYSIEQLTVMALLSGAHSMSKAQIITWICDRFQYYRHVVSSGFCEAFGNDRDDLYYVASRMLSKLDEALGLHELQIERLREGPFYNEKVTYTIDLRHGLPFIWSIINPESKGSSHASRLFTLPAELRNGIYEMVFGYNKKSGLIIESGYDLRMLNKLTPFHITDDEHDGAFGLCNKTVDQNYNDDVRNKKPTRPYKRILDPLLTCRQFYKEAMPTFYRINHFHTNTLSTLYAFLKSLPRSRTERLRHITTTYWAEDVPVAPKTFRLLAEAANLRTFNIRIDERRWMRLKNARSTHKVTTALELPGIATLRSLRGLQEINIEGAAGDAMMAIREDLMNPKNAIGLKKLNPGVAGAKKRKASKLEEDSVIPKEKKRLKKDGLP